jgi:hypothetical protein
MDGILLQKTDILTALTGQIALNITKQQIFNSEFRGQLIQPDYDQRQRLYSL